MEYTNISLEKVEEKYRGYSEMNKFERREFWRMVMAGGDCERFKILLKSEIPNHVKSLGLEDID